MITEILRSLYLNRKNRQDSGFKAKGFLETVSRSFRVGLRDIDFNMHINNARYMVLMEKARWDHPVQTNSWDMMLKNKLNFIVAGIEMGYIREIRLFKKFNVETTYMGWDDKYFYLEQRFVADGKIHAYGLVKAVFMQNGKLAVPAKVAEQLNLGTPAEPLPEHMELWQKLTTSKRFYSTSPQLVDLKKSA